MPQDYNTDSWETFYVQFKHSELGRQLANVLPQKILRQFLSPVLTLAVAIKKWGITPADKEKWVIRIHGAELPEAGDNGRWFGLLPLLLGQDANVCLIYESPKAKALPSPNDAVLNILPAIIREPENGSLAADLTVISHPDFVTRQRQRQDEISVTVGNGACIALYWSAIDVAMEGGWFDHHGMVMDDKFLNPFALQNNVDGVAQWARYVAIHQKGIPIPACRYDTLIDLGWVRHHSGLLGYGHPSGQPGKLKKDFKLRSQDSTLDLLYVIDDLYVSTSNRWLYRFDAETRQLEPVYEVDRDLLKNAPEADADILSAYAWAAKIKLAYAFSPMESETVARDYFQWLQDCAKRGNPHASMAYARWLEAGYLQEPNPDHAFYEYRKAANAGIAAAQYIVGDMAFHDLKDIQLATEFFTRASENGYALAKFNLGLMHLENMIPGADPQIGIRFLLDAAVLNEVNSLCYLGEWMINQGKLKGAIDYWMMAADLGSVEASGHILNHAEQWRKTLPEKEVRAFKKKVRTYSNRLKAERSGNR